MTTTVSPLWRQADFVKLWAGQTVSLAGSLVGRFALPLVAVTTLQASPLEMSLLRVADLLPAIVFGLLAGVWVDRVRRRPIMVWADLGRALLLGSIPLAALAGVLHIEQLFVVSLGVGILSLLFEVAYHAYVPTLVSRQALVDGNAKLAASSAVVEVGGFAVAGALVQLLGAPITVLVDAVSFIASSATLLLIRCPEPHPQPEQAEQSAWMDLREGLAMVRHEPVLRSIAAAELSRQLAVHTWVAMLLLFLTRELRLQPVLFGPLFAIGGLSSLVGALLVERLVQRFGLGPTLVVAVALSSASLLLVPLAGGPLLLVVALVGGQQLFDAAGTIAEITQRSLIQRLSPDRLLGRVNASLQLVSWTGMLLGSLLGGVLGESVGLRTTMFIGALGALPSVLWLVYSPLRAAATGR